MFVFQITGIFVTQRARSSVSEGRKPQQRSGTSFPAIGITNTTPLQLNVGSLYTFQNFFLRKKVLLQMFE
jgi:hypothetical protein